MLFNTPVKTLALLVTATVLHGTPSVNGQFEVLEVQDNALDDGENSNNALENLNKFLSETSFWLPDIDLKEDNDVANVFMPKWSYFDFQEIKITDTMIGFIEHQFEKKDNSDWIYLLEVKGLQLRARTTFRYLPLLFANQGQIKGSLVDSSFRLKLKMKSPDFSRRIVDKIYVDECETDFTLGFLDVSGNFVNEVLSVIANFLQNFVEGILGGGLCSSLQEELIGTPEFQTNLTWALGNFSELVEPYYSDSDEALDTQDPDYDSPFSTQLVDRDTIVDYTDPETDLGLAYSFVNKQVGEKFGVMIPDEYGVLETDLGVNIQVRDDLLEDDENFLLVDEIEPIDFSDENNNYTLNVDYIKVFGLDTFTKFNPLEAKDNTIKSAFSLRNIRSETKITVDTKTIKEVTKSSDAFQFNLPTAYEDITLEFGVDDFEASAEAQVMVDQDRFSEIRIGSLVKVDSILPCIMYMLSAFDLKNLEIGARTYILPEVNKVFDSSLGTFVNDGIKFAHDVAYPLIYDALPKIVSTEIRKMINEFVFCQHNDSMGKNCPLDYAQSYNVCPVSFRDKYIQGIPINYKNLFHTQPPGGDCMGDYGDIGCIFKTSFLEEEFIANDPYEPTLPSINEWLRYNVADRRHTGTKTLDSMVESISPFEFDVYDGTLKLEVLGLKLENIDSFQYPLEILEPSTQKETALINKLKLGTQDDPFTVNVELRITFANSDRVESDHFRLVFETVNFEVYNALLLTIDELSIMEFRPFDLLNPYCVLALIIPSAVSEYERLREKGLNILDLDISMDDFKVKFECVECNRLGFVIRLMDALNEEGFSTLLMNTYSNALGDLVSGPYASQRIHEILLESSTKCPSHPGYDPTEDSNSTFTLFKSGNSFSDDLDTLASELTKDQNSALFLSGVSVYMLLPLFASLPTMNEVPYYEFNDPMSLQNSISSGGINLLDFTNLDDTMFGWAVAPLELFASFLKEKRFDPKTGYQDLGINVQLREAFSEGMDFSPELEFGNLFFESVHISGFDSFQSIDPYTIRGPQTIQSGFKLSELKVKCKVSTKSRPTPVALQGRRLSENRRAEMKEDFEIEFGVSDIEVQIAVFFAVDYSKLSNFKMGSLFDIYRVVSCLHQTTVHLELSQIHINVGGISPVEMSGFFDSQTYLTVKRSHQKLLNLFEQDIRDSLPVMTDKFLRPLINNFVADYISRQKECRIYPDTIGDSPFIDLRDLFLSPREALNAGASGSMPYGNIWHLGLRSITDNFVVADDSGSPKINSELLAKVSEGQSGVPGIINIPDALVELSIPLDDVFDSIGNLTFTGPYDIFVKNLDSITYPFDLVNPQAQYEHRNIISIGGPEGPVEAGATINLALEYEKEGTFRGEYIFKLKADKIGFDVLLLTRVLESRLMSFPVEDATNFWCWINTIPAPEVDEFGQRIDGDWLSKERNLGLLDVNIEAENFFFEIVCPVCEEKYRSVSFDINKSFFLGFVEAIMLSSGVLQTEIDKMLYISQFSCPHSPKYTMEEIPEFQDFPNPDTGFDLVKPFLGVGLSIFGFLLLILSIYFTTRRLVKRRHSMWLRTLPEDEVVKLYIDHMKAEYHDKLLAEITTSMMKNTEQVPTLIRYITPICVILNIGLFMSGHFNTGATIENHMKFGVDLYFYRCYDFSVVYLVGELWEKASKPLAAIVFLTSLVWPYLKQLITLAMWVVPPSIVSPRKRGEVFEMLDVLAKWSMIDIFILIIASVAFRTNIKSAPGWPEGYYGADMFMLPLWGLFANFLAQVISQISSHWILHYHRLVVKAAEDRIKLEKSETVKCAESIVQSFVYIDANKKTSKKQRSKHLEEGEMKDFMTDKSLFFDEETNLKVPTLKVEEHEDQEKNALCNHSFVLSSARGNEIAYVSGKASICITAFGILTIILVIAGTSIPYLRINNTGIFGMVQIAGGGQNVKWYSVVSTAALLMEVASYLNTPSYYVGMAMFASILVLSCMIIPIVQLGYTIYLWRVPLTMKMKRKICLYIEILKAWQYTEVFFLGTLIMMWQTGSISVALTRFMFGRTDPIFANLSAKGLIEERDARIIYVNATVEPGVAVHLLSAMMLWGFTHLVESAYKQHMKDHKASLVDKQINEEENLEIMAEIDQMEKNSAFEYILTELEKIPLEFTDYYNFLCSRAELQHSSGASVMDNSVISNKSLKSSTSSEVSSILYKKRREILERKNTTLTKCSITSAIPMTEKLERRNSDLTNTYNSIGHGLGHGHSPQNID